MDMEHVEKGPMRSIIWPEMAHDVVESPEFLWSTRIIDVICLTITGFICIYHLCTILSHNRTISRSKSGILTSEALGKWSKFLDSMTMIYIIFQFLVLLIFTLNIWSIIPVSWNCDYIVYALTTFYHLFETSFYFILIARLQVAFSLSSLAYSTKLIVALYLFVGAYIIFIGIGSSYVVYGPWVHDPVNWCHIHIHETEWAAFGVLSWIVLDVIISLILMYLFIIPIRKLSNNFGLDDVENPHRNKFAVLSAKYAILTYISIFVNLIGLTLYLLQHLTIFIEIGIPINCICIVLMHTRYHHIFHFCCGDCVGCCLRTKKKKKNKPQPEDQPELVANDSVSSLSV